MRAPVRDKRRMTGRGHYPSYKDLDPFIDLAWLKSLDGYVRERIELRLSAKQDLAFYTGPFLLDAAAPSAGIAPHLSRHICA